MKSEMKRAVDGRGRWRREEGNAREEWRVFWKEGAIKAKER